MTDLRCFTREMAAIDAWIAATAKRIGGSAQQVEKLLRVSDRDFIDSLDAKAFAVVFAHRCAKGARPFIVPPAPEPARKAGHETYWRKEIRP